ncbi:MAG: DNA/RNA non-specific endonuclease [Clostridia bacterium]|nr:DNA/RNA non-specific endonuclease [Clostridia bacterium]
MSSFKHLAVFIRRILALVTLASIILSLLSSCSDEKDISLEDIPAYCGEAYVEINRNVPYFTSDEITDKPFIEFSELDELRRAGVAFACLSKSLMPTEEREPIFSENPTGFYSDGVSNNNKYKFIDGYYVYNRSHLIGFQLCGENANIKNLITGTRSMNIDGMLPFENKVADYIKRTGYHVMYRATPMFSEYDLVARGVLLEGYSVEDGGVGICFCVFVYNVEVGVIIDYYNGENKVDTTKAEESDFTKAPSYVLNTSSKKYHLPECHYAKSTAEEYIQYYTYELSRFSYYHPDYSPCMSCKPHEYHRD